VPTSRDVICTSKGVIGTLNLDLFEGGHLVRREASQAFGRSELGGKGICKIFPVDLKGQHVDYLDSTRQREQ